MKVSPDEHSTPKTNFSWTNWFNILLAVRLHLAINTPCIRTKRGTLIFFPVRALKICIPFLKLPWYIHMYVNCPKRPSFFQLECQTNHGCLSSGTQSNVRSSNRQACGPTPPIRKDREDIRIPRLEEVESQCFWSLNWGKLGVKSTPSDSSRNRHCLVFRRWE